MGVLPTLLDQGGDDGDLGCGDLVATPNPAQVALTLLCPSPLFLGIPALTPRAWGLRLQRVTGGAGTPLSPVPKALWPGGHAGGD
jgi:hypothetical protein